jgi:hypothetical protein
MLDCNIVRENNRRFCSKFNDFDFRKRMKNNLPEGINPCQPFEKKSSIKCFIRILPLRMFISINEK